MAKKISRPGYGIVYRDVMTSDKLTAQAKALYALLSSYCGSAEFAFPSIETMAKNLCVERKWILKYTIELESVGLIEKQQRFFRGLNHNYYAILYPPEEFFPIKINDLDQSLPGDPTSPPQGTQPVPPRGL